MRAVAPDFARLGMRGTIAIHQGRVVLVTSQHKIGGAYEAVDLDGSKVQVPAVVDSCGHLQDFMRSGQELDRWLARHGHPGLATKGDTTKLMRAAGTGLATSRVLVVGERLNREEDPDELDWWEEDPGAAMRCVPAFPPDSPSGKVLEQLGLGDVESVNLLPPGLDRRGWDRGLARENARLLAKSGLRGDKLILCGRRVQDAFMVFSELVTRPSWGTVVPAWGSRCFLLPHPSPQSILWNDLSLIGRMRHLVQEFLAE